MPPHQLVKPPRSGRLQMSVPRPQDDRGRCRGSRRRRAALVLAYFARPSRPAQGGLCPGRGGWSFPDSAPSADPWSRRTSAHEPHFFLSPCWSSGQGESRGGRGARCSARPAPPRHVRGRRSCPRTARGARRGVFEASGPAPPSFRTPRACVGAHRGRATRIFPPSKACVGAHRGRTRRDPWPPPGRALGTPTAAGFGARARAPGACSGCSGSGRTWRADAAAAERRARTRRARVRPRRRGRGSGRPRTGRNGAGRSGARCGNETPKRTPNRILGACRSAAKRPQLSNAGGDPSKSWPPGLALCVGEVARGSAQSSPMGRSRGRSPKPRSGATLLRVRMTFASQAGAPRRKSCTREEGGKGRGMRPPGVLRIQNPELSGWVAGPRAGGHRVSRR